MEINEYMGKLDVLMFGVGVVTGVAMREQVEIEIVKVEKGKDGMRRRADPHLKSLNECALYYKLENDSKRLIESLKQLSATLNAMQDISQSIEESSSVQQSLQETEDQFNVNISIFALQLDHVCFVYAGNFLRSGVISDYHQRV